jgi:hypothetical protein
MTRIFRGALGQRVALGVGKGAMSSRDLATFQASAPLPEETLMTSTLPGGAVAKGVAVQHHALRGGRQRRTR